MEWVKNIILIYIQIIHTRLNIHICIARETNHFKTFCAVAQCIFLIVELINTIGMCLAHTGTSMVTRCIGSEIWTAVGK